MAVAKSVRLLALGRGGASRSDPLIASSEPFTSLPGSMRRALPCARAPWTAQRDGPAWCASLHGDVQIDPVAAIRERRRSTGAGWARTRRSSWHRDHQYLRARHPNGGHRAGQQEVQPPAAGDWCGQVDVPWTATATFQSCVPNVKPYTFQMTGTFTGLNATSSEVTVADVTSGRPGATGKARPLRRFCLAKGSLPCPEGAFDL